MKNLFNTNGEEFRDDSNLNYKRDTSEVWGIGILIVVSSVIFGKAKGQIGINYDCQILCKGIYWLEWDLKFG